MTRMFHVDAAYLVHVHTQQTTAQVRDGQTKDILRPASSLFSTTSTAYYRYALREVDQQLLQLESLTGDLARPLRTFGDERDAVSIH